MERRNCGCSSLSAPPLNDHLMAPERSTVSAARRAIAATCSSPSACSLSRLKSKVSITKVLIAKAESGKPAIITAFPLIRQSVSVILANTAYRLSHYAQFPAIPAPDPGVQLGLPQRAAEPTAPAVRGDRHGYRRNTRSRRKPGNDRTATGAPKRRSRGATTPQLAHHRFR